MAKGQSIGLLNADWTRRPDNMSPIPNDRSPADMKKRPTPGASILHFHALRWFPFNPNRITSNGELASRGTALLYRAKLGDHRPSL